MPISPMMLHTGLGIFAAILCVTLLGSIFTLLASWVLLLRYRKAVAKLMSAESGVRQAPSGRPDPFVNHRVAEFTGGSDADLPANSLSRHDTDADWLYRNAMVEPWYYGGRYAVAGVFFGLTMTLSYVIAFSQNQINPLGAASHPFQYTFMFWTFLWPVVLTTDIVVRPAWHFRYGMVSGYFAILALLGVLMATISTEAAFQFSGVTLPAWSGETPMRLLTKWAGFNVAPTLLILAFRNRRVRAIAPLVLSFMTVVSAGLLAMYVAVFYYKEASIRAMEWASNTFGLNVYLTLIGYFLAAATVACAIFGVVGWCILAWIRKGYQNKILSDQSLGLDAVWLIFSTFYALIMVSAGPGWLLSAAAAFLLFRIALRAGNRFSLIGKIQCRRPAALLVLRVFSLGKRSEALFDAIAKHWRYIGNVQLITGTDLAITTVAPHRFLAFVSRKLNRLFITDQTALARNLQDLDTRSDRDGRYRINDFFCHADTWQKVLSSLVARTDAVLMDLRSFSRSNNGCIFEIQELLNAVPLQRVIFVTDKTTDKDFFNEVLQDSWHALPPESPNREVAISKLGPFEISSDAHDQVAVLLRRLCYAAAGDQCRLINSELEFGSS